MHIYKVFLRDVALPEIPGVSQVEKGEHTGAHIFPACMSLLVQYRIPPPVITLGL